jgi:ABC-type transport system involved in multi-copper enzyme maturation permease subunit
VKQGSILEWGVKIVTFLFAMFGGFLTVIAPPEEANSRFAVGLSSFLALVVLLLISALIKKPRTLKSRKKWLTVAVTFFAMAVITALVYWWNLNSLTFPYPPESKKAEYVAGTKLTPDAQKYKDENPGKTISSIVADYGGMENRELVWSPGAIRNASMILLINYIALVLSLAATIFCLTEGLLSSTSKQ